MNLPARLPIDCAKMATSTAYKTGHRDARHAAAELALLGDACAEALRSALLVMQDEALPLKRHAIQQAKDAISALDGAAFW